MATGHVAPHAGKPRIASTMGKAKIFSEALPFIKKYRGKTVVIKYGGSAMVDDALRSGFADDVAMLHYVGIKPVIVHGGGPAITRAMQRQGIEPRWVDGLRATDAETMKIVQATLVGEVNPDIVRLMNIHGAVATGVSGLDANLLVARSVSPDLGFVGEIAAVDPAIVHALQDRGYVPVIAPVARGEDGEAYNVNADVAAGAIAAALGAAKLVYLTDVEGLYRDLGDDDSLISVVDVAGLRAMLESGGVSAGMLPKLRSCIDALDAGVERAHILDGRIEHAVLLEIFTPEGIGTMVVREGAP